MKSKKILLWVLVIVFVVTVAQGSILHKKSLLRPLADDTCYTCRAEDRPFAYPLVSWLVKMKDMLIKGMNVVVANTKDFKLDSIKDFKFDNIKDFKLDSLKNLFNKK